MYLLSLASQHAEWLAQRQAVTASNIANADTPAYKAMDVVPFDAVLGNTALTLARTDARHMEAPEAGLRETELVRAEGWDTSASGNTVTIEKELMKLAESSRAYALDTGLMKTFHRMILTSLKV